MTGSNEDFKQFNVEDFLNFSLQDSLEQEQHHDISEAGWDAYPTSWSAPMLSEPAPLFNFDGASLLQEEYIDPFADLLQKRPKQQLMADVEFKRKLQLRRQKLDHLARKLSTKEDISLPFIWDIDCKQSSSSDWLIERPPVQVYTFSFGENYGLFNGQRSGDLYLPLASLSQVAGLSEDERALSTALLQNFVSLRAFNLCVSRTL